MKRVWAGIGLLATAGIGTAAFATPGGAEELPEPTAVELGATWSPNPAAPGEAVTLTPDEPCPLDVDRDNGKPSEAGVVVVFSDQNGDGEIDDSEGTEVEMADDGSWVFETNAPDEAGDYEYVVECRSSTFDEELRLCGVDQKEVEDQVATETEQFKSISYSKPAAPTWNWFNCEFEFYDTTLTVASPETPTTVPPTVPPPATPIEEAPPTTG
jgi:hypothetical protein